MPKIIVPLRARTWKELEPKLAQITDQVDIVEIWLDQIFMDFLRQPDLLGTVREKMNEIKTSLGVEFLAVCKSPAEQGQFGGSAAQRVEILQAWLQLGGDYVDLDINHNHKDLIRQLPLEQVWLSHHDFAGINDLEKISRDMKLIGPAVYKFAVSPQDENELKMFTDFAKSFEKPAIFTTMGPLGEMGRAQLKETTWGGFYALNEAEKTAEGQPVL